MAAPPDCCEEPTSPCTGVCEIDAKSGECWGCSRTLDEVVRWPEMTVDQRRQILQRLARNHTATPPRDASDGTLR